MVALASCGPTSGTGGSCPADGQVVVTWTVRGAPPSSGCTGIDHLDLTFVPEFCVGGVISPVPCTVGKITYRMLPRGPAQIELTAYNAPGTAVATGFGAYDIEPSATAPLAIDLR